MRMSTYVPLAAVLLFARITVAAVESEAYYLLEVEGRPAGVTIQRNSFDEAKRRRTISYLVKTQHSANDLEFFVRLHQDEKDRPLSYEFISSVPKQKRLRTTGTISGNRLDLKLDDGDGKPELKTLDLPLDIRFSAYLGPLLTRQKPTKGQAYSFEAISEEDGKVIRGDVLILDVRDVGARRAYRTVVKYQTLEHEMWFLDDGLTLFVHSTSLPAKTYLVTDGTNALRDGDVAASLVRKYFGTLPDPKRNPVGQGQFVMPKDGLFSGPRELAPFANVKRIPLKP